jgi:hypothetical protein
MDNRDSKLNEAEQRAMQQREGETRHVPELKRLLTVQQYGSSQAILIMTNIDRSDSFNGLVISVN